MSIAKSLGAATIFAAICATQALADVPTILQVSSVAEARAANAPACRSERTYHYTYRERSRPYHPGAKARAHRPRRKFPTH